MKPKTIGIRELIRNYKKITRETKRGMSFEVMNHREALFQITPIKKKQKTTLWDDLKDISFSDEDRDLSKKIDEIVYDV